MEALSVLDGWIARRVHTDCQQQLNTKDWSFATGQRRVGESWRRSWAVAPGSAGGFVNRDTQRTRIGSCHFVLKRRQNPRRRWPRPELESSVNAVLAAREWGFNC